MGLTNYRCFAGSIKVELRPVTVVLGRNNSGKSALVRAPLVVSTGIDTDTTAPLDLDRLGEDIVDSFADLIYGNRPHGSVRVELGLEAESGVPLRCNVGIRNISELRTQVVEDFAVAHDDDPDLHLKWEPGETADGPQRYTLIRTDSAPIGGVEVPFQGLLPAGGVNVSGAGAYSTMVRESFGQVRYLGPFRDRPSRLYRVPARMPTSVGASGEYTAGILASDSTRGQRALLREINAGLAESLPGWTVDVVERGGMVSVVLKSRDDDTVAVNLVDTGTGVAQALPIFVQRALDRTRPPEAPVLEIVEQPELHLHPYAHAALADLYLSAARETGVRFLIETHSETLLLRLRVRIAERKADPDDVAVYFVESINGVSEVRRINIDAAGNLDYWPEGVFSEDYRETKALAKAQLELVRPDAR
ncbi:DUF3696 domain-containing protein [Actinoplanes sp. NPDC051851]|uniref:AAA family ATPase n=1 Tax=Actinoplanes sp. NPDC051851 TaxID=3154753 RepID=UPI00342D8C3C